MANVGEIEREIEVVPLSEPAPVTAPVPVSEPAQPEPVPA